MKMLLISALLLVGCGRGSGGDPPGSNAGKAPREAIVGAWTVSVARLAEQPHMKSIPAEKRALALEMAQGMLRSLTVEFTADTYAITVGGVTNRGTYTVKSEAGPTLVLSTKGEDGELTEMVVTVEGEGLLLLPAPDEHPIPLARK